MRNKILRQMLTSYDNKTYDTGRILATIYFFSAVIFTAWVVFHGGPFDPQGYLVGGGAFLGGLGVYLFGDKEEPAEKMTAVKEPTNV